MNYDHENGEPADHEGPAAELGLISGTRHSLSEDKETLRGGHRNHKRNARCAHWVIHFVLVGLLAWTMLGHNLREQGSIIVRPTEGETTTVCSEKTRADIVERTV